MGHENEIKAKMEIAKIFLVGSVGSFLIGLYTSLSNIDKVTSSWSTIGGTLSGILFLAWVILVLHRRYIELGIALDR